MQSIAMEDVIANSFMDYHQKGFHYLCLKRSLALSEKLYFFEGDVSQLPEVVAPHNHRYAFNTMVVEGIVENRLYARVWHNFGDPAQVYQRFDYLTPLNGGNGFTWAAEEKLYQIDSAWYSQWQSYEMEAHELHTIQIREPGTILRLLQYEDEVPVGEPTSTWTLGKEPPSLTGLYRKPRADEVIRLMKQIPEVLQAPKII